MTQERRPQKPSEELRQRPATEEEIQAAEAPAPMTEEAPAEPSPYLRHKKQYLRFWRRKEK